MGFQAIFETKLTWEKVEERIKKSPSLKMCPDAVHIMLYPVGNENFKVQLLANGVANVWCRDLESLEEAKSLLNESLNDDFDPQPFKEPKSIRWLGSTEVPIVHGSIEVAKLNYSTTVLREDNDKYWVALHPPGSTYYRLGMMFKNKVVPKQGTAPLTYPVTC